MAAALTPNALPPPGGVNITHSTRRTTPDARQKNRRTEIILEPNLDEVFELLE